MSTIIDCPSCGCKLQAPEELLGKQVRCPTCSNIFDAVAGPAPPPGAVQLEDPHLRPSAASAGTPSPGLSQESAGDLVPSPTGGAARPWEGRSGYYLRRDCEPHRGTLILIFGILSLVFCGLVGLGMGIAAWIMGQRDLRKMDANMMDPAGRGNTQAGRICGMIGTILSSLNLLFAVAYVTFFIVWVTSFSPAPPSTWPPPSPPPATEERPDD